MLNARFFELYVYVYSHIYVYTVTIIKNINFTQNYDITISQKEEDDKDVVLRRGDKRKRTKYSSFLVGNYSI